jgi:hypothetical protein
MTPQRAFWYMIGLLCFISEALIIFSYFKISFLGLFLASGCLLSAGICLIRLLAGVFKDE